MAEFNPPRKWKLGRDLSYTTSDLTVEEIKALKGVGVKVKRDTNKTETVREKINKKLFSLLSLKLQ